MTCGLARTWLLAVVFVVGACGDDSEASDPAKAPTIYLDALTPSQGTHEDIPAEGELALPCDGTIGVSVHTENWVARAPGGCGQTQSCGHLEAIATAESTATTNAFAVSNPVLHLPVLADWVGRGSVLVRLVRDDNSPYLDATGNEISASRVVVFTAPVGCDEASN